MDPMTAGAGHDDDALAPVRASPLTRQFKPPTIVNRSASLISAAPRVRAQPPALRMAKRSGIFAHMPGSQGPGFLKRARLESGSEAKGEEQAAVYTDPPSSAASMTEMPSQPYLGRGEGPEVYVATWREPQYRKHKTWDGDTFIIVDRSNHSARLHDAETGRRIATTSSFYRHLEVDDEFTFGGKEVQIVALSSYAEYCRAKEKPTVSEEEARSPPRPAVRAPVRPTLTTSARIRRPVYPAVRTPAVTATASSQAGSFYASKPPVPEPGPPEPTGVAPALPRLAQAVLRTSPQRSDPLTSSLRAAPRYDPHAPGAIVMPRPDKLHQQRFNKRKLPIVDVVVDPALGRRLRPHQVEGVKFMYKCVMGMHEDGTDTQGAILADEMGLGKTLQTIALLHTLLKQSPYWTPIATTISKAIVVCPLTLVKNWKREFTKWVGSGMNVLCVDGSRKDVPIKAFIHTKQYSVMIIGYEKLRTYMDQLKNARPPVDLVVCDEGHRLKSRDAKTTKMFEALATQRRIILSGTPIQNDLTEFYAMVDFVAPGLLGNYSQFKKVFEDHIMRSRAQGCTAQQLQEGRERSEMLRRATMEIILHRSASILAGYLPSRTDLVVFCAPTRVQLQVYESIVGTKHVANAGMGGFGNALVLIGLLRKLCDSTRLLAQSEGDATSSFLTPRTEELLRVPLEVEETSGKLKALSALLGRIWSDTDDKVVIVSNFTSALDVVGHMMRGKYPCVRLDGKTKQEERQSLVNEFNRAPRSRTSFAFLLSAKSGGTGLNLIGANRLILLDSDWNPSTDKQAMARIHRDGQKKECFVYRFLLAGTMDEKIYQRQLSKIGLSDSLMDGSASSVKSSDAFTQEELRDIFTLHTRTTCITHDQLQCDCAGSGRVCAGAAAGDADVSTADGRSDDGSDPYAGFVAATQRNVDNQSDRAVRDKRAKLAALFSWAHIAREHAGDALLDPILAAMVDDAATDAGPGTDAGAQHGGAGLDGADASEFDMHAARGGEVLYVFQKSNMTPGSASSSEE